MDRAALSRATESTDAPTPGYLYVDLSRNVSSNPNAAKDTAGWLIQRLQNKNHNVKYKCLKLIAKLAAVHPPYFQRSLTVDPTAMGIIKDHLNYRGPPDPIRGDEIYTRVRTVCQEALDALYKEHEKPQPTGLHMQGIGGGGGGMHHGAPPPPGNAYPGASGPGVMQGFGSHPDPRLESGNDGKEMLNKVSKFASDLGSAVVGMIKDPLAKNAPAHQPQNHIGSYRPNSHTSSAGSAYPGSNTGGFGSNYGNQSAASNGSTWSANPPGRTQLAASTGGQWTMASNRGANAVRPPTDSMGSWSKAQVKTSIAASTGVLTSAPEQDAVVSTQSQAQSDGSYEKYLIGELCPATGFYAVPDESKMAQFEELVEGLDVNHVSTPLLDLLDNDSIWQVKGKALHVIHMLVSLSGEIGDSYKAFFFECRGEIEPYVHHSKIAVREPATKVMKLFGLSVASSKPKSKPQPQPQKEVNLLEFDSPEKAVKNIAEQDLMGSLDDANDANTPEKPNDNLFGGLTEKSLTSSKPKEESNSTTDLFAEMNLTDSNIQPKEESEAKKSGFSFMNDPSSQTSGHLNGESCAPKSPIPDSKTFDPLLSLSAPGPGATSANIAIDPTAAYPKAVPAAQIPMNSNMMYYQVPTGYPITTQPQMKNSQVMLNGGAGHYFHLDVPQKKKEDSSFDFVKDVVKNAK